MHRRSFDEVTWYWDDYQCPEAVGPLTESLYPYLFQEFTLASRLAERMPPAEIRFRFDHGYFYVSFTPGGPISEAGQRFIQMAPEEWHRQWLPEIRANLARLATIPLGTQTNAELAGTLQEALRALARHWGLHLIHGAAHQAVTRLTTWYQERFPDAEVNEGLRLLHGQSNSSVDSAHGLWELSQMVRPEMIPSLAAHDVHSLPEEFRRQLDRYLDRFGRRTAKFCDLGYPTWLEAPGPALDLVLSYAREGTPDPLLEVARLAADREGFTAAVRERLAPSDREPFAELLRAGLLAHPLLEDHAFWIEVQSVGAVRLICAEFGRRLAAVGLIPQADDVALLTLPELYQWGAGMAQPALEQAVTDRRAAHAINRQWQPRPWIGAQPESEGGPEAPAEPPSTLSGIAAVPGVVQGRARVATTMADAMALKRGEILVAAWIHPDWMPLFSLAAAVVTDQGGALSHAAVVAREYGLPAVVGTGNATQVLQTGQILEVDGTQGTVTIIPGDK